MSFRTGVSLLLALGAIALQPAPAAAEQAPSPEYRRTMVRMLTVSGIDQMLEPMVQGMIESLKLTAQATGQTWSDAAAALVRSTFQEVYGELMTAEKLADIYAPIYAKHLSLAELQELMRFYDTPIGRKTLQVLPSLVQESIVGIQSQVLERMPRFQQELTARFSAAGIALH